MTPMMAASAYVAAAFGLAGTLVGGLIAGTVSLRVARQAREAAERSWMRDSRRVIYDRFLTHAQKLLIACEGAAAKDELRQAYLNFFEVYGVVQTVAELPVVAAARVYAYRLLELTRGGLEPARFARVAQLVRFARHDTIDAMRAELGLTGSAGPPKGFNAFAGTDLEDAFAHRPAER
jgi:hypothetical protein